MTIAAALLAGSLACSKGEGGAPAPTNDPAERARAFLAPGAVLPSRPESVAVADSVAIAAAKAPDAQSAVALTLLAAELRARLFRAEQTDTDGREALELYRTAARALAGTEAGCEADARRALLWVELSRDARAGYREVYLTTRRQAALLAVGPSARRPGEVAPTAVAPEGSAPRAASGDGSVGPASARPSRPIESRCLVSLELALARAIAYRPEGDELRALERDGESAAAIAHTTEPIPVTSAFPAVVASAHSAPSATSQPERDVVRSTKVASGPVRLVDIDKYATDSGARVVLKLSGPTTFDVGTLEPDAAAGLDARVYVDIARATAKGVPGEISVGGAVRRVRVGAHKGATRVVLDLSESMRKRVFYLPEPFRIVIDVSTRQLTSAPESGPREVRRVAIDPGHGGTDDGAVGPTGLREKDVVLDIAHRLAPILSHELKVETLLTRDSDAFVPLDLRAARANAFNADLFISIHCNASENGTARGIQSYVLDPSREAESSAARLAARENSLRGRALDPVALDAEVAMILSNLNVAALSPRSQKLAELLQRAAIASVTPRYAGARDGGVKTAGFFVLAGADMPAVLFETSFISNPDEERRLGTADYRQKLADAIANAIRAYRDGK